MTLLDSHAHLAEECFDHDRDEVLRRARAAGVGAVVVIGYDLESSRRAVRLADEVLDGGPGAPALYATAGFAPHQVAEADEDGRRRVRELLAAPRVVAVGEIGLDYHYDMPRDAQRQLFDQQLGWAAETGLPVVIHSREAEADVVAALEAAGAGEGRVRGVIHCFTESAGMAEAVLELGLYVSFSGILTFPNAGDLRAVAARVPLARTLIETDSPYLAPAPHRGRRNEPAFVAAVAECLAQVHGERLERVAAITAENARRLFGLAG